MQNVTCVGVGNIGRAWAIAFAKGGHNVTLYDQQQGALDSAMSAIKYAAKDLKRSGMISSESTFLSKFTQTTDLRVALLEADFVQESIIEDIDAKKAIFLSMDEYARADAIIGSSTSEVGGSQFMQVTKHPERCLVVHPTNPPYLVPLVELCASPWTCKEVLYETHAFLSDMDMTPVVIKKEIPGFVLNRLQTAVIAESLHLVGEDYISASDLDAVMSRGLGLRWAFMGPFLTGHLNASKGYASYMQIYGDSYKREMADLKPTYPWDDDLIRRIHDEISEIVSGDEVPEAQKWRDNTLMKLRLLVDDIPKPINQKLNKM